MKLLNQFFGRIIRGGSAKHLIHTAELLEAPSVTIDQMKSASSEEIESLFLNFIDGNHGAPIDWRSDFDAINESLSHSFSEEEKKIANNTESKEKTIELLKQISYKLEPIETCRSLRVLESLGDFYIAILIQKSKIEDFKRINSYWMPY